MGENRKWRVRFFGSRLKSYIGMPDFWEFDMYCHGGARVWFRFEHTLVQQVLTGDWLLRVPRINRHAEHSSSPDHCLSNFRSLQLYKFTDWSVVRIRQYRHRKWRALILSVRLYLRVMGPWVVRAAMGRFVKQWWEHNTTRIFQNWRTVRKRMCEVTLITFTLPPQIGTGDPVASKSPLLEVG